MSLDKLRGLNRLCSFAMQGARLSSVKTGSVNSTWTENNKTYYQFTSGATLDLRVDVEQYYTKRNRNDKRIIGKVGKSVNDYLVCAGGGGGGPQYPSGGNYGGGGGGGGGGLVVNTPQCPAPLRSPTTLSFVPGSFVVQQTIYNPFLDNGNGFVNADFTITVGSGGGANASGSPSSLAYPTAVKNAFSNPNLGTISATGGGTQSTPGGSGGGGQTWSASGGGSGIPGQGRDGGAGGPAAPSSSPGGQGGGGGGYTDVGGAGNYPSPVGNGGNGVSITLNGTPITFSGGGGGGGRSGIPGPPHGTSYPGRPNASGGTGGGGGGASAPTSNSFGGGGGGYSTPSGGTQGSGAPGTIIIEL